MGAIGGSGESLHLEGSTPSVSYEFMLITNIINATITAYCACKLCCGPNAKGICANGKPPIEGKTVAASRRFPFGTTVAIGSNTYVVQDRLAKQYDSRFDIYFNNHSNAKKFGVKTNQIIKIITTK